jgi:hypothetical protein
MAMGKRTLNMAVKGWLVAFGLVVLLIAIVHSCAHARDVDGRYAASPLRDWFDQLRSGKGPYCSDADGTALSDFRRACSAYDFPLRRRGQPKPVGRMRYGRFGGPSSR